MELKKVRFKGLDFEVSACGTKVMLDGRELHQSHIKSKSNAGCFSQISVKGKVIYVHHIVAAAYVINPKPASYRMILHKDCNPANNHYKNLQYGNSQMLHLNRANAGFENRGGSKINEAEALKIAKRLDNGEFASHICKEYGVSEMSIARIRKRYCTKKQATVRYPKEVKKTVSRLLESHAPKLVAEVTGIRYETIWKWSKSTVKH